eukprot:345766_1
MSKLNSKQLWVRLFCEALECDSWGQTIEAVENYRKLVSSMTSQTPDLYSSLSIEERLFLAKLKASIMLRITNLQSLTGSQGLKLETVKSLGPVFADLFTNKSIESDFPVNLYRYRDLIQSDCENLSSEERELAMRAQSVMPVVSPRAGTSGADRIAFHIIKIGLKDAEIYVEPRVCVTVADAAGNVIEHSLETSPSFRKEQKYIFFEETVQLKTPFSSLSKASFIFFEFKHYKEKKRKISTKCWGFIEHDEIKASKEKCIELYRKPTDFTRKRIFLHSVKPLYLHVRIDLLESNVLQHKN